jgi:hypothetical protein
VRRAWRPPPLADAAGAGRGPAVRRADVGVEWRRTVRAADLLIYAQVRNVLGSPNEGAYLGTGATCSGGSGPSFPCDPAFPVAERRAIDERLRTGHPMPSAGVRVAF